MLFYPLTDEQKIRQTKKDAQHIHLTAGHPESLT